MVCGGEGRKRKSKNINLLHLNVVVSQEKLENAIIIGNELTMIFLECLLQNWTINSHCESGHLTHKSGQTGSCLLGSYC